jgi:1-acyl-sn-glycerol-3-phosphate acyltransferase
MLHALTDVVVGEPWRTAQTPWPRTREHTLATSALLWQHLRDELSHALSLTGRALPGPLPAGDIEDDPDTGFVEHLQGVS